MQGGTTDLTSPEKAALKNNSGSIPKAELHIHIEGTLEPEMIFQLGERNQVKLPYASVEDLRNAYHFVNLQSFLDLYYAGMSVLQTEDDFRDMAIAYFEKSRKQGVLHAELFFDPQAHTARGIPFETVIDGLWSVVKESESRFGITSKLIMCFLRDQSAESAMKTLECALPYGDRIVAVGLDSAELNNPPSKFTEVFSRARAEGFMTVAHAGEEGPPEYVWEALDLLHVSRIDHGVRSLEDAKLVQRLVDTNMPLTVCPLSNVRLRIFKDLGSHNLKKMLEFGVCATVNSDDPAYFGGYVGDNFVAVEKALGLTDDDLHALAKNSFIASFLDWEQKQQYLEQLNQFAACRT